MASGFFMIIFWDEHPNVGSAWITVRPGLHSCLRWTRFLAGAFPAAPPIGARYGHRQREADAYDESFFVTRSLMKILDSSARSSQATKQVEHGRLASLLIRPGPPL